MQDSEWIDLIGLLPPITYLGMLAVEWRWPARQFPPRRGWRWTGIGFMLLIATVGTVVPLIVPQPWLEAHRWMDGSALGIAGGTAVGWVVLSGLNYGYHRAAHGTGWLWRLTHQMHHSPQRVDISGSALFHPVEMTVQVLLQLFATVVVLGLQPVAAALVGYLLAFHGMFQHWNVHTPPWIGYFIQRPEAHCVHHRRGVHAYNYGDLPLWDLLFGSFRNPRRFQGECGFETPADRRLGAMALGQDVNLPLYGTRNLGAGPQPGTS